MSRCQHWRKKGTWLLRVYVFVCVCTYTHTRTYICVNIYIRIYEISSENKERLRILPAQLFHCTRSVMWCVQWSVDSYLVQLVQQTFLRCECNGLWQWTRQYQIPPTVRFEAWFTEDLLQSMANMFVLGTYVKNQNCVEVSSYHSCSKLWAYTTFFKVQFKMHVSDYHRCNAQGAGKSINYYDQKLSRSKIPDYHGWLEEKRLMKWS